MGDQTPGTGSGHVAKKGLGSVGDWFATVLVLVLFMGMLLAVVSVLLGRAE